MNILDLPFNRHLGLSIVHREGNEVVCLDPDSRHENHLGTIHAGATYSLAEAASGHALLNQFGDLETKPFAVLRMSAVKYRSAASGRLTGIVTTDEEALSIATRKMLVKGRGKIDIRVEVKDETDETVTSGDFVWFVQVNP